MRDNNVLLFRVDASIQMGTGHVMRCLALAQAWLYEGGEAYFCTGEGFPIALDRRLSVEGVKRIELQRVANMEEDAETTISYCRRYHSSWLVVDGYHFDANYQQRIKAAGLQLLVIDDYGHADRYEADFVLNQNISANANLYPRIASYTQLLMGCKYALLRREFWAWRDEVRYQLRSQPPSSKLRILVTLGGSDPNNTTMTVLEALKELDLNRLNVKVIVGGSNPHLDPIKAIVDRFGDSVSLYFDVTQMPELMAQSDLAIAAGGSTCWELALLGVPALLIVLAENQSAIAKKLDELKVGINLGEYQHVTPHLIAQKIAELLQDLDRLTAMSQKALELVDGYGSNRTIKWMRLRVNHAEAR